MVYRAGDETAASEALADFYDLAEAANIPEGDRLRRTIRRWEDAVLAYYRSDGLSNARTEAVNGLVKKVQRIGHGFRNMRNSPATAVAALRRRRMARSTRCASQRATTPFGGVGR